MRDITMRLYELYFVVALIAFTYSSAIPKQGEGNHKDRVIDQKLSDAEHNADGHHNNEYDHEAFLGKENAKEFDNLSPEESKEKLGIIVDKMDKDKDGQITKEELKNWITYVQNRYVQKDTERMWKDHDIQDGRLTWNSYKKRTYGYEDVSDIEESHHEMVKRDERRWKKADNNSDGFLNQEEFSHFLHPEEVKHMQDIVVQETIEDIDKDKDGFISLEEYIGDMWPEKGSEEPEWVANERQQFNTHRDTNSDGKMDSTEVKEWILPNNYDQVDAEASHLISEAGKPENSYLTKDEILEHYDVFVGSQATDFGEALMRHDEF